jgi:hypothetical protein
LISLSGEIAERQREMCVSIPAPIVVRPSDEIFPADGVLQSCVIFKSILAFFDGSKDPIRFLFGLVKSVASFFI